MKQRGLDLKNREEDAKAKLHKQDKEASKSTGKELKLFKAKLKDSEATIANLEKQLTAAAENHEVLKLDFAATTSDLEVLKATTMENRSDIVLKEELRKVRKDMEKYKGLYERNRTNEQIIKDNIANAVRVAEGKQAAQFELWKARTAEVVADADWKLAAAEERALAAEKVSNKSLVPYFERDLSPVTRARYSPSSLRALPHLTKNIANSLQ